MNGYFFHLEKLLNIRIMEERSAALELASKSSKVQELERQIYNLKLQFLQLRSAIGKENLVKLQLKMAEIQKRIEYFTHILYVLEKEKSFAHQNYLNALKKYKILENLKGKYGNKL